MVVLEQERADVAASDFAVIECELGIDYVSADHPIGLRKIMLVVTVHAAECDHRCNGVTPATSATGALLIVCAPRWHVAQGNTRQCANIDSNLHRCGAGKNVYRSRATRRPAECGRDILE